MTIEKFPSLDIKCLHTIKYALQHIDHALQQLNQTNMYALQNRLLIIGEAINNLSKNFKSEFTKMPWDVLSKIRTDNSHWFFCLDISLLVTCIKQDIAALIKIVDDIEADSPSAKTEPVPVALEKVVKDTEKKRRAYEQKRSRRKGEVYEDVLVCRHFL